jgi:hypothetical protein
MAVQLSVVGPGEGELYVDPVVVESIPEGLDPSDFVSQLDRRETRNLTTQLDVEATSFLDSGDQTMLLLGRAGSGKSVFLWKLGRQLLGPARKYLAVPAHLADSTPSPWLPVYIDLKHYRTGQLSGLLLRTLTSRTLGASALPSDAATAVLAGRTKVRLVVMCDGLDELAIDAETWDQRRIIHDFVGLLSEGVGVPHLPPSAVKVRWT